MKRELKKLAVPITLIVIGYLIVHAIGVMAKRTWRVTYDNGYVHGVAAGRSQVIESIKGKAVLELASNTNALGCMTISNGLVIIVSSGHGDFRNLTSYGGFHIWPVMHVTNYSKDAGPDAEGWREMSEKWERLATSMVDNEFKHNAQTAGETNWYGLFQQNMEWIRTNRSIK